MAVRSATREVASLSSDSPSRIDTSVRGRPIRRAMAVAATASGGATTAPIAIATGQLRSGKTQRRATATATVVAITRPTESSRMGRRLALKSTSEVCRAAAYSKGGSSPKSTTSGPSWTCGRLGTKEAAMPITIKSSGAGIRRRSLTTVPASTVTARAMSPTATSTLSRRSRGHASRRCPRIDPARHRGSPPQREPPRQPRLR